MREANFGNCVAKILRKSMRNEREMMWWRERETIEFWWCSYRNSYPKCNLPRRSAQKGERKIGIVCGNGVAKIVTERKKKSKAMELPKLWGRGKKKNNYGNWVAQNAREEKIKEKNCGLPKLEKKKKELWQFFFSFLRRRIMEIEMLKM